MKVFTYDNSGQKPKIVTEFEKMAGREINEGTRLRRRKGIHGHRHLRRRLRILPETRAKEFAKPAKTLVRAHGGPIEDLFWAVRNNGTPCSNFADYSGPLTEMILTGQLAMFAGAGKKVEWDVAGHEVYEPRRTEPVRPPQLSQGLGSVITGRARSGIFSGLKTVDDLRYDSAWPPPAERVLPFLRDMIGRSGWSCTEQSRPVELPLRQAERKG